ncbi:hypothetical protein H0H81_009186 [Sphagnurus paluster]|uniref:Uncharacterized protein n=1 Tax=Sphagnurus paluster TaxID=117069 RepID=A0A9P7FYX6_9AGAR|nr:hypothetical protein H0H81_009186 [Sphagnurus paluster]
MPSYTTIFKTVFFLGASAVCAAPFTSPIVDAKLWGHSRRDSGCYLLGVRIDDPCATLRHMRDVNQGCQQSGSYRLFHDYLSDYCENDDYDYDSRRERDEGYSLFGKNLNILGHTFSKDRDDSTLSPLHPAFGHIRHDNIPGGLFRRLLGTSHGRDDGELVGIGWDGYHDEERSQLVDIEVLDRDRGRYEAENDRDEYHARHGHGIITVNALERGRSDQFLGDRHMHSRRNQGAVLQSRRRR